MPVGGAIGGVGLQEAMNSSVLAGGRNSKDYVMYKRKKHFLSEVLFYVKYENQTYAVLPVDGILITQDEQPKDLQLVGHVFKARSGENDLTDTPEKETGEVALKFRADTTDLKGETVVVFEKLYRRDVLIASHSDLNDKAQSILVTDESSPKTGDDSMELLLLLITILIFAVVVMAIMILKYKTRK